MLVDVVELYFQGRKLSREARRQLKPTRGRLTVECRWTHANLDNPPLYAELHPFTLATLASVRLRYWRGRNVVLSGWQLGPAEGGRRGEETRYEQWWWCRIVGDAPPVRARG